MLSDRDIAAALELAGIRSAGSESSRDYTIEGFRLRPGLLDLRLTQSDRTARLEIALPSSGGAQPWLYRQPTDIHDWIQQFLIWLDEEMDTDGLGPSRAREERGGESYVIVEPYGWRVRDSGRHRQLLDSFDKSR